MRKRLSIKMRVTLWYALITVLIILATFVLIVAMSYNTMCNIIKGSLMDSVQRNANTIRTVEDKLFLEDIDGYDGNKNIIVYNRQRDVILGVVPYGFPKDITLNNRTVQQIDMGGQHWYVYDTFVFIDDDYVVVRGIVPLNSIYQTIQWAALISICVLPALMLMVVMVGYRMAERAFRPVNKISEAVSAINDGKDLSKRINMTGRTDEIVNLAKTFDGMFDRLEDSFNREKQFSSDASHELRTPVSVIMTQCEYAINHLNRPDEVRESLDVILKQSQKMSTLISQLLAIAREENRKKVLDMEVFDMCELCEIVLEEMEHKAEERNIKLISELEEETEVRADRMMMVRLLVNLISNAIKYGRENGTVKLVIKKDNENLIGYVEDNGIGIDSKDIEKIWDKFSRVDVARTGDEECSTGLGLPMVKGIVEAHNGTIRVESIFGEGSKFIFILPIIAK